MNSQGRQTLDSVSHGPKSPARGDSRFTMHLDCRPCRGSSCHLVALPAARAAGYWRVTPTGVALRTSQPIAGQSRKSNAGSKLTHYPSATEVVEAAHPGEALRMIAPTVLSTLLSTSPLHSQLLTKCPLRPPDFSSSRTSVIFMPRSTDLHMS